MCVKDEEQMGERMENFDFFDTQIGNWGIDSTNSADDRSRFGDDPTIGSPSPVRKTVDTQISFLSLILSYVDELRWIVDQIRVFLASGLLLLLGLLSWVFVLFYFLQAFFVCFFNLGFLGNWWNLSSLHMGND